MLLLFGLLFYLFVCVAFALFVCSIVYLVCLLVVVGLLVIVGVLELLVFLWVQFSVLNCLAVWGICGV